MNLDGRHRMKRAVISIIFLLVMACGIALPPSESTFTPSPTFTQTASATPLPAPTETPTQTPRPLITSNLQVIVLAENLPGPDDLVLAPDGSIYLSDVSDGTIRRYTQDGNLKVVLSGLSEPEGMIILPDGSMIIAEQGANRLVRYEVTNKTLQPFLNLSNNTNQPGVDGLAYDSQAQTIIVPDSPNGTVLRVSLDGRTVTQIAGGFARPTGAWVEPDGSILIADENGNAIFRARPDGTLEKIADLPIPDDVIEDGNGNLFVNTIGDNAVHLITAGTRQDLILATDIIDPQGIIFDNDGNLIVTDPGHHRLIKLITH